MMKNNRDLKVWYSFDIETINQTEKTFITVDFNQSPKNVMIDIVEELETQGIDTNNIYNVLMIDIDTQEVYIETETL